MTTAATKKTVTTKKASSKPIKYIQNENQLGLYLKEINFSQPLTRSEEAVLAVKIRGGDRKALNKLIQANLKFVVAVCRKYKNKGLPLSDLINEGNLGLIRAAKRFDETKHFKFISYAVWWVRQAILQALSEQSKTIKLPIHKVGMMQKISRSSSKLEQELGRTPNFSEVSDEMNLKEEEVEHVIKMTGPCVSLNAQLQKEGNNCFLDIIENKNAEMPDQQISDLSLKKQIHSVVETLTEQEQQVVQMYFGVDSDTKYTLTEISTKLNLTRERVRQIKEKAIKRLRHFSRSEKLELFKP
jgi:RNA polymerase primary sigma factor